MRLKNYPFASLPFPDLFKSYVNGPGELQPFYSANPFSVSDIAERSERINVDGNRPRAVELLRAFNERFDVAQATFDNIGRLENERAVAVVTGQQLGIYGGPLFTVLKTISAIHLAGTLEKKLDRPVIPVFWLADEDHDFEEVRSLALLRRDDVEKVSFDLALNGIPPVSELKFTDQMDPFRAKVKEILPDTDFSDELWNLLNSCYEEGRRFDEAFGNLMANLFSKHGLVLAGSNVPEIKNHLKELMVKSITKADKIREALETQTEKIAGLYHQQVTIYDSNLFYLNGSYGRTKISRNGSNWKTDEGKEWTTEQLTKEIEENPERFSPNVFLRPVLQDALFPTLGYVAGPGEISYYGQMKEMYRLFDIEMPVIFPRLSATLIEPAIDRILDELPFGIADYHKRIEDLESAYVEQAEQVDIEAIFADWKEQAESISKEKTAEIKRIDPTLEGAAGKTTAVFSGELDKLKGKVYRSVKQQEQTQLQRIRKIKAQLFPGGGLQERGIGFIYFMNKYGTGMWDELLEALEEDDLFNQHKLVYL